MKINIITLHCTDNCGSTLQAMALQYYLTDQGHNVEIIDYEPKYLKYNGSVIKSLAKQLFFFRESISQTRKNRVFSSKYLRVTKTRYLTLQELEASNLTADMFIAGSDQIWNPSYQCGTDPAYYLCFIKDNALKYAYAASVGKSNTSQMEQNFVAQKTQDFAAISVRERCTQQWLASKAKCPVEYVCDPVFLLSSELYQRMGVSPKLTSRYILVYLVQKSPLLDELLEHLKKRLNCIIVLIYGVRNNCQCDYHIRDVSPDEFLGFLNNATYVVSSSFHATAFSHILEKNFAVLLPKDNKVRIEQLLQNTGLSQRIVRDSADIPKVLSPIDFAKSGIELQQFISDSKHILNRFCEQARAYKSLQR